MVATREAREEVEIRGIRELAGRRGWTLHTETGWTEPMIGASRQFRYRCGTGALIYVRHALDMSRRSPSETPLDTRRAWEAGVVLPFAGGPEVSHTARRLDGVRDWSLTVEMALQAPLALERASSLPDAERVLRPIDRLNYWYMICCIFDLDYERSHDDIVTALIRLQAPGLLPASTSGKR